MKHFNILTLTLFLTTNTVSAQTENLFSGGHADVPLGITIGYVSKDWRTNFDGNVFRENLWGQEDKRLHGLQLGVTYQPCLPIGAGIHTGLFYECYLSVSSAVRDAGYDNFTEHNLYLPLHLQWRLPFSEKFSLSLFGGVGFNWAMWGTYNEHYREYYYDGNLISSVIGLYDGTRVGEYQKYGQGNWPRHLNMQWEFGCNVRYKAFQLGFTYSIGDTNHEFYAGYKTRQDKIAINFSYVTSILSK